MVFPKSLKVISQGVFAECEQLREAKFGDGLEVLGSDEEADEEEEMRGVFQNSALENVVLPSTLKRIESWTFCGCENLKSVDLPDRLETICMCAFRGSGLQKVVFPGSLRTLAQWAFMQCKSLKTVLFNEGLEILGEEG